MVALADDRRFHKTVVINVKFIIIFIPLKFKFHAALGGCRPLSSPQTGAARSECTAPLTIMMIC